MDMIERYVAAVARHIPEEKRADISREIRAHLQDKMDALRDELGRLPDGPEVATVLERWGHPHLVAAQYVPPQPLVAREHMSLYWKVLAYSLAGVFLLQFAKSSMVMLQAEHFRLIQALVQLVFGFFDKAAVVFTVVTLVFYAHTTAGPVPSWFKAKPFTVNDLPPVERPWQAIRWDDLLTDAVSWIFLFLLLWPSLWMGQATLENLPIEMTAFLQGQIFALTALIVVGLNLNVWCALRPYWTRTTLLINASLSALTTVIMIYLGTGADLLAATSHTLPAQLTLDALNRLVSHGVIVVGLFTGYETLRDLWRWRKLDAVNEGANAGA